jgi:hypothetical protein
MNDRNEQDGRMYVFAKISFFEIKSKNSVKRSFKNITLF